MMSSTDTLLLLTGAMFRSVLAAFVLFHRRRNYASWAKWASAAIAVGGFIWGGIQWMVLHWRNLQLTRDTYYLLVGHRGFVGGFAVALSLSILMARPYEIKDAATRSL
jgi:hypothetical protein